jgi:aryl-alcohol dehydrogenase-like predicted oxidoreductase
MQRRQLGKTGLEVSIITFGGIVVMNVEQTDANNVVAEAVDRGINYFDVAPSYGDAEVKLGPALEPFRQNVSLACKTGKRDKEGAAAELRQSLKNLRTDHFDVYQLHGLSKREELVFFQGRFDRRESEAPAELCRRGGSLALPFPTRQTYLERTLVFRQGRFDGWR